MDPGWRRPMSARTAWRMTQAGRPRHLMRIGPRCPAGAVPAAIAGDRHPAGRGRAQESPAARIALVGGLHVDADAEAGAAGTPGPPVRLALACQHSASVDDPGLRRQRRVRCGHGPGHHVRRAPDVGGVRGCSTCSARWRWWYGSPAGWMWPW